MEGARADGIAGEVLNHLCDPTVGIGNGGRVNKEGGSYDFVALRDIEAKEVSEPNEGMYYSFARGLLQ